MRIIAGQYRRRTLRSLPGIEIRPTADRLRETLFNVLSAGDPAALAESTWLDLYAGTGAVGIEALSRGAAHAWFLERDRRALDTIRKNLASLGLERRATILAGKVLVTLERCPGGIVFLDPPYDQADEYAGALDLLGTRPPALTIAQHSVHLKLKDAYGGLHRTRMVKHGDNALSFYAE
jgi:16S rRNA (guanine966-N2)-methyltransferase